MKRRTALVVFLSILAVTLLACRVSGVTLQPTAVIPAPVVAPTLAPLPTSVGGSLTEQDRLIGIYSRVSPGVVAIMTFSSTSYGLGTGWVYSADGHIVTNEHVVEGADQIEVDFPSGLKVYGTVVGSDKNSDLAVIKVDVPADQLHPLSLGDSDTLQVGQIVVAIGNPLGYYSTMTSGIISALGRAIHSQAQASSGSYYLAGDIIQTDAAINPGNSGGPLLNLNGEVIGVNESIATRISTDTGEPVNSGIGFAISINIVKRVVPFLIRDGNFDYPYLGISTIDDLSLSTIEALGLKSNTGVYVLSVVAGSPAEKAGVRAGTTQLTDPDYAGLTSGGDLIVAVDGRPIQRMDDLMRYMVLHKQPGDAITLTVLRGDQSVDLTLTLGARP